MNSFSVEYRNPGHWDIYINKNRVFTIRGCTSNCIVANREGKVVNISNTVGGCMGYICDQLMFEPL